jgi:hypothetical protein
MGHASGTAALMERDPLLETLRCIDWVVNPIRMFGRPSPRSTPGIARPLFAIGHQRLTMVCSDDDSWHSTTLARGEVSDELPPSTREVC